MPLKRCSQAGAPHADPAQSRRAAPTSPPAAATRTPAAQPVHGLLLSHRRLRPGAPADPGPETSGPGSPASAGRRESAPPAAAHVRSGRPRPAGGTAATRGPTGAGAACSSSCRGRCMGGAQGRGARQRVGEGQMAGRSRRGRSLRDTAAVTRQLAREHQHQLTRRPAWRRAGRPAAR